MERSIGRYFAACNAADYDNLIRVFTPDAVHYFPSGSPFGTFRGADAIARGWIGCVEKFGSRWTVDRIAADEQTNTAVIEWTHFQVKAARYVRGDEWYQFNADGLITEIRAYYACPASAAQSHELGGFPYDERKYPIEPSMIRQKNL